LKCGINLKVGKVVSDTSEGTDDAFGDLHRCADFLPKGVPRNIDVLKQLGFLFAQSKHR